MATGSRGDLYESSYERRAAAGEDVHGEANFIMAWGPSSVLDAGCGTGRVGRELHRRGLEVVGVDLDEEMLETARHRCPEVAWLRADVSTLDLGRTFDLVVMAGNVINFCRPERRPAAIRRLSAHLLPGGLLVNGHSIGADSCTVVDFDRWADSSGLHLRERWSSWDRQPFASGSDYCLSVFEKAQE